MIKSFMGISSFIIVMVVSILLPHQKKEAIQASPSPSEQNINVSDFGLNDHQGNFHHFSYYDNYKGIVLFVQGNACPIVRNAIQDFQAINDKYASKGIKFLMINANLQDNREKIREEAKTFGIQLPILIDDQQLVAKMLNLRVTAEVLLIDMESSQVRYRGAISDRLGYETQKQQAQNTYLADALDHFLSGEDIEVPTRKTMGCAITRLSDKWPGNLTYVNDIAPILKDKCVSCHQEGGIAPWAMTDYRTILGWSAMIKEVIYTKRMPPWHADKEIGHFSNDLSLSDEEIGTVIAWIDGKMERGQGPDPLADMAPEIKTWTLGEPDMVLNFKPEKIPATGIIEYRYQEFKLKFKKDVYVEAVEIIPDKAEVLHHVLATLKYPKNFRLNLDRNGGPG